VGVDPTLPRNDRSGGGEMSAAISNALVRLYREYLGRGPTKARTSVRENTVLVLLEDTLTKAERSLIADGKQDEVLRMRHSFQMTMRTDMVAAVERATGRHVIAFMSDNHIGPDLACEIFVLEPEAVPLALAQAGDDGAPAE
jgi:uncharacterized protein YbcI